MKTSWRHVLGLPLIAAAVLFSACATTQIINQWSDPSYTSPSFKRIMVIGVSKQDSIRRTFEDELVAQLKALGIDAVPSYLFIPEAGQVEESRLKEGVRQAGADARDHHPARASRKKSSGDSGTLRSISRLRLLSLVFQRLGRLL